MTTTLVRVIAALTMSAGREIWQTNGLTSYVEPMIEEEESTASGVMGHHEMQATQVVNVVNTGIGNLRAVLGGGRHVETDAAGNIHVASLTGTGATYSLFYAVSTDGGTTWNVQEGLGIPLERDRYPAIAINHSDINIAFHEESTSGYSWAYVLHNEDSLGDGPWTSHGPFFWYHWISFLSASPTDSTLMASWVDVTWPVTPVSSAKSTDGGATWAVQPTHPDSMMTTWSGIPVLVGDP